MISQFFSQYPGGRLLATRFRIDPHAPSGHQMRMKTEFNIINLRETMMVYPFSFSSFKSLPFTFSICLSGGYKGGEAPIIAVFRIDLHVALAAPHKDENPITDTLS